MMYTIVGGNHLKEKNKKRTVYWDSDIAKTRRRSVLGLTPEESARVSTYKFTKEEIRDIEQKAKRETKKNLCVPFSRIVISILIALFCLLYIWLIPHALNFQDFLLQKNPNNIFYQILIWVPICMTVGGGFAYLYLLWFGIMTLVLPLSFIDSHFLSREYPRMKKEIQEDLKTELAAKRLIAERKARTAPFAGDTQSQVLLNNHDALVYPSGARTLTHKI